MTQCTTNKKGRAVTSREGRTTTTGRQALLLLDLQEAICREEGAIGRSGLGAAVKRRGVLGNAARALHEARKAEFFIGYARLGFDDDYVTLTSKAPRLQALKEAGIGRLSDPGSAICSEIAPRSGELVVNKVGIDPLIGTPLLGALINAGIMEIVLGGVTTNHVVESCARHAADAGMHVVVLADLCAAQTDDLHEHSIQETLPFYSVVTDSASYFQLTGDGPA
jgi:nicotinamidase-related amidase